MNDKPRPKQLQARLAIWLAISWVAAGALFKFFAGSPNDLPPTVQNFALLRPAWTFRIAIGVELSVVILALMRPRFGWIALALLFLFFDVLLVQMMQAGDSNCGCFGSSVPIRPWQMAAIDTLLIIALVATRPWAALPKRPLKIVPLLPLFAIVLIAPWFKFTEAKVERGTGDDGSDVVEVVEGDWYNFQPATWQGQMIHETDLAAWIDPPEKVDLIPPPAHVIIYRNSCEHCRDHFIEMQANPITDRALVLIRVPENAGTDENDVVGPVKPEATLEIELKELSRGYGIMTPVMFDLDDVFTVQNIIERHE